MKHPVDIHVGKKIKELRHRNQISQTEVANRLKLSFQQVQKYETAANRVSASRLYEIAEVLAVPVSYFFDDLPEKVDA